MPEPLRLRTHRQTDRTAEKFDEHMISTVHYVRLVEINIVAFCSGMTSV